MATTATLTDEQRTRLSAVIVAHFPGVDPMQVREEWLIDSEGDGWRLEITVTKRLTLAEVNEIFASASKENS